MLNGEKIALDFSLLLYGLISGNRIVKYENLNIQITYLIWNSFSLNNSNSKIEGSDCNILFL